MTRVYLATKQEVQNVEQSVTTISTQINTADTGIDARVTALETGGSQVIQNTADIAALDTQLNDATTGLVKAVTDLDTQINEAGTGVIARLDDLEQGGTSTTKFRTHSPSGKYEDGEVVQRGKTLYKANTAIDGSSTSVPFVVGLGLNTWTPLDQKDPSTPVVFQADLNGAMTGMQPSGSGVFIHSSSTAVSGNSIGFQVDADRGRISYATDGTQATLEDTDLLRVSDANNLYQKTVTGAATTIATSNLTVSRALVSSAGGKVGVSAVTSTELGYLDKAKSNIQDQIDIAQAHVASNVTKAIEITKTSSSNQDWFAVHKLKLEIICTGQVSTSIIAFREVKAGTMTETAKDLIVDGNVTTGTSAVHVKILNKSATPYISVNTGTGGTISFDLKIEDSDGNFYLVKGWAISVNSSRKRAIASVIYVPKVFVS